MTLLFSKSFSTIKLSEVDGVEITYFHILNSIKINLLSEDIFLLFLPCRTIFIFGEEGKLNIQHFQLSIILIY